ncbi:MAG: hypothetical protein K6T56_06485 [Burkholderiales bacterium]|nr:hypothetical protein [Burkholderiales bacterium]
MNLIRTLVCTMSLLGLLAPALPAGAQDSQLLPQPRHPQQVPASVTTDLSAASATREAASNASPLAKAVDDVAAQQPSDPQPYVTYDGAEGVQQ